MLSLHVWGRHALFTRPEMKAERVSYDVMTPSAARGVLEAIHWKPAMVWRVTKITVLNQIRFVTIRRNEVGSKIPASIAAASMRAGSIEGVSTYVDEDRQQRASVILMDVGYVIDASIELTAKGRDEPGESVQKHVAMAKRRAEHGQYFHHPYLGCREFACAFELLDGPFLSPHASLMGERDLGWMLHDIDYSVGNEPRFFRPVMVNGVIEVPAL